MKKSIAILIGIGFLAAACITPSCTTTNTSTGTTVSTATVQVFTAVKSAEEVLKTAEKFRLSGKITQDQFIKVKAAYDALRVVEQLIIDGKTGGTVLALSTKTADLAAIAAEIGIAFSGGGK